MIQLLCVLFLVLRLLVPVSRFAAGQVQQQELCGQLSRCCTEGAAVTAWRAMAKCPTLLDTTAAGGMVALPDCAHC